MKLGIKSHSLTILAAIALSACQTQAVQTTAPSVPAAKFQNSESYKMDR